MNPNLPAEVVDFANSAERGVRAAGGVDLARRAADDPTVRAETVGSLLERLGLGQIEPRADLESALAAAQLTRLTGAYGLPYPVSARLAAQGVADTDFLTLVDERTPQVEHPDLPGAWLAVDADGATWSIQPDGRGPRPYPSMAAVHGVRRTSAGPRLGAADVALLHVLESWRLLGAAEAAHAAALSHVQVRQQFGRPLARFQGVQFHVADAEVAVRGLRQLAQFTSWRSFTAPAAALVDALALRVQAVETVGLVLGLSHLLHGAVGFCDEHDLAVLDMAVTPATRLPWGLEETTEQLADLIAKDGFASPFADPSCPTVELRRIAREAAP
jgi:Acyl-CoA dehydrogenase, C-terminal domain